MFGAVLQNHPDAPHNELMPRRRKKARPTLIKIGDRIINLGLVKCVERVVKRKKLHVHLFTEKGGVCGTEELNNRPLNFRFVGDDAKILWEKLCDMAEPMGLPGEMPTDPTQ